MTDLIRFHLRWREGRGTPLTDAHSDYHDAERAPWTACRRCLRTWRGHEDKAHRCVPLPPELERTYDRSPRRRWLDSDDDVLLLHTDRAAAIFLGRTELACQRRRYRLAHPNLTTTAQEN